MKNLQTNFRLNFGGFYYSIHDELIDSMLSNYFSDEDGEEIDYSDYNINYTLIREEYIKRYLESFEEFLSDELNIGINIINDGVQSPRFYNYSTDYIAAALNSEDTKKILNLIDDDIIEYIEENSKSCSGFISFYSGFDEVIQDQEILVSYIFDYIISELYTIDIFLDYYDRNYMYETLYSIDFIEDQKRGA